MYWHHLGVIELKLSVVWQKLPTSAQPNNRPITHQVGKIVYSTCGTVRVQYVYRGPRQISERCWEPQRLSKPSPAKIPSIGKNAVVHWLGSTFRLRDYQHSALLASSVSGNKRALENRVIDRSIEAETGLNAPTHARSRSYIPIFMVAYPASEPQ
ncbi:hypothetical protein GX48_06753 [Paracoccidioides brasiliensis]|nr:hypothetical protein GX48_06753 [Paracoccidioides brasiliensis]